MKWILIYWFVTGAAVDVVDTNHITFKSEKACLETAQKIKKIKKKYIDRTVAFCVKDK